MGGKGLMPSTATIAPLPPATLNAMQVSRRMTNVSMGEHKRNCGSCGAPTKRAARVCCYCGRET